MRAVLLVLALAGVSYAGSLRHVPGDNWEQKDAAAVNINFDKIDRSLSNTVTKTGTQDISGTKNFETISATSGTVTTLYTSTIAATNVITTNPLGAFKNRIINGDMVIDQRNAGAVVTVNAFGSKFGADRMRFYGQTGGAAYTAQQSTDAPDGFRKSTVVTVTTADATIGATEYYHLQHNIEGHNIADAGFGTSWAKQITLSFWVKSSLTGNFGAAFGNNTGTRTYPFTYTINAADTWERKVVSITADTTGTWEVGNLIGLSLRWSLGMGSNFTGPANAWAGANYVSPIGSVDLVSTNGATWKVTGVQLELGAVATAFESRMFPVEFGLAQRYYEKSYDLATVPGTPALVGDIYGTRASGYWDCTTPFKVRKRGTPSVVSYNPLTGASGAIRNGATGASETAAPANIGEWGFTNVGTGSTSGQVYHWHFVADSEL